MLKVMVSNKYQPMFIGKPFLVINIMAAFIMAVRNNGGQKYSGLFLNNGEFSSKKYEHHEYDEILEKPPVLKHRRGIVGAKLT